jgi:hypothetical protein
MIRVVRWLLEHLRTPAWPQAGPVVPAATPGYPVNRRGGAR